MPILTKVAYNKLILPTRKKKWSWPKRQQLESSIQSAVIDWVKRTWREDEVICRKRQGDARVSNGWPDYEFLCRGGCLLSVEFKRPGEELTDLQRERHKQLRALGHLVYVIDNVEQGKALLQTALGAKARSKNR